MFKNTLILTFAIITTFSFAQTSHIEFDKGTKIKGLEDLCKCDASGVSEFEVTYQRVTTGNQKQTIEGSSLETLPFFKSLQANDQFSIQSVKFKDGIDETTKTVIKGLEQSTFGVKSESMKTFPKEVEFNGYGEND